MIGLSLSPAVAGGGWERKELGTRDDGDVITNSHCKRGLTTGHSALTEAEEVHGVHAMCLGQGGDVIAPMEDAGAKAMDEEHGGPLPPRIRRVLGAQRDVVHLVALIHPVVVPLLWTREVSLKPSRTIGCLHAAPFSRAGDSFPGCPPQALASEAALAGLSRRILRPDLASDHVWCHEIPYRLDVLREGLKGDLGLT
jgi:hypothetical protein